MIYDSPTASQTNEVSSKLLHKSGHGHHAVLIIVTVEYETYCKDEGKTYIDNNHSYKQSLRVSNKHS
jgi:hypothetical protein